MEKEEYVYKVFQSIAKGYDGANLRISLGLHMIWKKRAAEMLSRSLPQGGRLLDICCGTGDMTELMLHSRPDIVVTALDFSPEMLSLAERRFAGDRRVKLVRGNALNMPFERESFDAAVISFGLRNTADYTAALREAARVLKAGGGFCCVDSFLPECSLVRPFYNLYFSLLMPLLGGGIKKFGEYRWLSKSTKAFVSPEQLKDMLAGQNMQPKVEKSFMFGSCEFIYAIKCEEAFL